MEKTFTQSEVLDFFRTKIMLSTDRASNYLNISTTYFKRLITKYNIPNYTPDENVIYFDVNDLDNYLRSDKKMSDTEIDNHAFKFINKNYKVY